jgi:hypothetical protein
MGAILSYGGWKSYQRPCKRAEQREICLDDDYGSVWKDSINAITLRNLCF